jgi:transposase
MGTSLERPAVLTPDIQREIVQRLVTGSYLSVACRAVGIHISTFNHWRLRWEKGDPDAQAYADFFAACARASSVAESNAVAAIYEGAGAWQGRAWFLERRFPQRWGKKDRAPLPPPRPRKPIAEMTAEELDVYERSLDAGRG